MKDLKELLEYIKQAKFIKKYTNIGINSGIRHRLAGTGTNKADKQEGLKDEEKLAIKSGLQNFVNDVNKVIDTL